MREELHTQRGEEERDERGTKKKKRNKRKIEEAKERSRIEGSRQIERKKCML